MNAGEEMNNSQLSRITEIRLFLESLNSGEAHYAYGYLRGYFNINEVKK
jgi:hypothetical protein